MNINKSLLTVVLLAGVVFYSTTTLFAQSSSDKVIASWSHKSIVTTVACKLYQTDDADGKKLIYVANNDGEVTRYSWKISDVTSIDTIDTDFITVCTSQSVTKEFSSKIPGNNHTGTRDCAPLEFDPSDKATRSTVLEKLKALTGK